MNDEFILIIENVETLIIIIAVESVKNRQFGNV